MNLPDHEIQQRVLVLGILGLLVVMPIPGIPPLLDIVDGSSRSQRRLTSRSTAGFIWNVGDCSR
jgi:hypothetical protein